ncbi:GNAT family N-acetyltransferase [Nocardioides sp. URHA0020]|uniref:GNAT family N-acetyltransferase n=1 Tax=Nocardioides sp. URHA0020 TaxID=1380392 RepID=UPI00048BC242|nr:GNAT family N-acetyltransferase [Nocardioides sp. URHA0020]
MSSLEFYDDPSAFLDAAEPHLAADPVLTTVIASVTRRHVSDDAQGRPRGEHPRWWVAARDAAGAVVGVAMRTAPFEPHPVYALPMPDDAARALARALHDREEPVGGINGALPTAQVIADELALLRGQRVRVQEHTRLFELGELVAPPAPPGALRVATAADAELALAWFLAFESAAAEQAGRPGTHGMLDGFTLEDLRARIDDGVIWFWEDEAGDRVHLTGANPPAYGVARVGPVYTPTAQRGRGYASAAVAQVSRQYVEQGVRVCLFTDQANPTSNAIYQALGYRAVVDMVNLLVG